MENRTSETHPSPAAAPTPAPAPYREHRPRDPRKAQISAGLKAIAWAAPGLARVGFIRKGLIRSMEKNLRRSSIRMAESKKRPARVIEDRLDMTLAIFKTLERALASNSLSQASIRGVIRNLARNIILMKGEPGARAKFIETYGCRPPEVLLISPTKLCNLNCKGCYADSTAVNEKLDWPVLDRLVNEVRTLWGSRFVVFSGGEPLAYRDGGHDIMDLVEKYPDVFFMMYTNSTLIDDAMARRMAGAGNVMPAISIEGLREKTDARRGDGVFDRVTASMRRLRREKVLFGVSITASRDNVEEVLSDRVIDYYFNDMGAHFAWIFQYMPIGRAITLDSLPTPEQRLWMWRRSWQLIRDRKLYVSDFWNGGTAALGCIAAGRSGGYMAVCWNGDVVPCVFMPYSPANINTAYAEGRTLCDVWNHPFLQKIRSWQTGYGYDRNYEDSKNTRNWMMPCPIRDHYEEFYPMLKQYQPKPLDENAGAAMNDEEYRKGLIAYNKAVAGLLDPIWRKEYMNPDYKIPEGEDR
ncbi:MAG: radical SAM protein [Acidobacteriota bacterium]